ncbi:MAG TPA: hypothetical protein VFZ21_31700 [Gemmatimonadaceae bacterium]|nr:hypothetical protein [Gemmatimonadaceae bacterium]
MNRFNPALFLAQVCACADQYAATQGTFANPVWVEKQDPLTFGRIILAHTLINLTGPVADPDAKP